MVASVSLLGVIDTFVMSALTTVMNFAILIFTTVVSVVLIVFNAVICEELKACIFFFVNVYMIVLDKRRVDRE